EPEDALGSGIPAVDVIVGPDRDDRVGRRRDERLEPPFRVRDLAVEARVAQRDRQVLREHLEKLALPRVDRAPGGAVVRDQRAAPRGPSSAWRRSRARRTTAARSWRAKGLIRYSKAPLVSACLTVSSDA